MFHTGIISIHILMHAQPLPETGPLEVERGKGESERSRKKKIGTAVRALEKKRCGRAVANVNLDEDDKCRDDEEEDPCCRY